MKNGRNREKPKSSDGHSSDMKVAGIDFNPGPDAEERLRRLFIFLLKPDDGSEEESQ